MGGGIGTTAISEALEDVAGLRQDDVTPAIGADGVDPAIDGDGFLIAELRITGQVQVVGGCFPLRPVFLVARFGVADRRHRIAGQALVIIPALEPMARVGHIVGCRERCPCAVGVFSDIAAVDPAAVCVQRDGVGFFPLCREGHGVSDFIRVKIPFRLCTTVIVIPAVEAIAFLCRSCGLGELTARIDHLLRFCALVIEGHDKFQVGNRNTFGNRAALAVDDGSGKFAAGNGAVVGDCAGKLAAGDGAVVGDLAGERALFDGAAVIEHRTLKLGGALIAAGDLDRASII